MMRDFLSWAPWLLKKFNYNINNIKGMEKIQIHCAQIITVLSVGERATDSSGPQFTIWQTN